MVMSRSKLVYTIFDYYVTSSFYDILLRLLNTNSHIVSKTTLNTSRSIDGVFC